MTTPHIQEQAKEIAGELSESVLYCAQVEELDERKRHLPLLRKNAAEAIAALVHKAVEEELELMMGGHVEFQRYAENRLATLRQDYTEGK